MMLTRIVQATLIALAPCAYAQTKVDTAPLDFQAVVTSRCDDSTSTDEMSPIGAVLAQTAAKTILGLATGLLEEAGKDKAHTVGSAFAPGHLYAAKSGAWTAHRSNCVVFWYGKVGSPEEFMSYTELGGDEGLRIRWRDVYGFTETPYIYGEARIVFSADMSAVRLQPVRYFARPIPEAKGLFGRSANLLTVVELTGVGDSNPFAAVSVGLNKGLDGPVLVSSRGLRGRSSGWFARPEPSRTTPADDRAIAGLFTAKVVSTANLSGSKLAAALAGALKEDRGTILDAIRPSTDEEKTAASLKANTAAFQALAAVAQAQAAFDSGETTQKPELEVKLRQAKYEADMALEAAGYPKRYNVAP